MNDDLPALIRAEEIRRQRLTYLNRVFAVVLLLGLAVAMWAGGWCHPASTALWALAALAVGALIGLLFGIPRVVQTKPADSAQKPAPSSRAEVNNNLVEVSDWLTKIIVGIGLVQLNSAPAKMKIIAGPLARCLDSNCGMAIAVGVIVFFAVAGFLVGYINSRTFIAAMILTSDGDVLKEYDEKMKALEKIAGVVEDSAGKSDIALPGKKADGTAAEPGAKPTDVATPPKPTVPAAAAAAGPAAATSPAEPGEADLPRPTPPISTLLDKDLVPSDGLPPTEAPPPADIASFATAAPGEISTPPPAAAAPPAKRVFDPDDPNRGVFGESPDRNSRRLEAVLEPAYGQRSAACWVHLRVASTDPKKPLTGKVVFHLHPTFKRYAKYSVPVRNGVAEDTILSWGAFTVGVEADNGATRLELNLADVSGGTPRFYTE